jgi:lipoprotein LprG
MKTSSRDRTSLFAVIGVGAAAIALLFTVVTALRHGDPEPVARADTADPGTDGPGTGGDDGAVADRNADPIDIVRSAAEAMGAVTSVEFRLDRSGAPIYVDQFGKIALDGLRGQFTVPTKAQAELSVTVNGTLATRLGAVAIDDEVWISNPVTGDFETLPSGYDIDPSRFFDPENGWKPLLANLHEISLVGIADRGGERYHLRGTAPAAQVRDITVNLVRDQDVVVDFWIHPGTWLVTAATFDTTIDGEAAHWELELSRYGDQFRIEPPGNVRSTTTEAAGA